MRSDDIIENDYGMCSQQSIIFQDVIKDYGFDYGSVGFNAPNFKHFASAVKVNDDWYFFDSNMEPKYDRTDPSIFNAVVLADKDVLNSIYVRNIKNNSVSTKGLKSTMVALKDINKFPASTGVLV